MGEAPDVVIVWTEDFDDTTLPSYDSSTALGFVYMNRIIDMKQWLSTNGSTQYGLYAYFYIQSDRDKYQIASPGASTYAYGVAPTSTVFTCKNIANVTWRTGVTYKYFVSEKWW